jgi:two-component system, OmpR family, response regulator RpaA
VTETKEAKRPKKSGRHPDSGIGKTVFTTGQIARLCLVAPRTVSKWFDAGKLKGYRIPTVGNTQKGGDRRVDRAELIAFLKSNNMPLRGLESIIGRVLLVSCGPATCAALTDALAGCEVRCSPDGFAAGQKVSWWRPETIVVDLSIGTSNAVSMARAIREAQTDTWTPRLIALAGDDTDPAPLTAAGFDTVLSQGDDAGLVATIRGVA